MAVSLRRKSSPPKHETRRAVDARSPSESPPAKAAADPHRGTVAILGWHLGTIEAMHRTDRSWWIVGPSDCGDYARTYGIPFVAWDLSHYSASSAHQLAAVLREKGVDFTVPLFEPLVEWHGAIDAELRRDPGRADWVQLFRNKAMMKRRAQLRDIPVGVFQEARTREEVGEFFDQVNHALLAHEPVRAVHIKALREAGCKGHYRVASEDELAAVPENAFPCLVESDLEGQEIACEVWIHDREIVFMNISEYVRLGHSVFVPPSAALEERREEIRTMNQRLVEAFEIERGFIHPEWFLAADGSIHFGEVAYRVPGGNAFELIERAYGFSPYEAHVLVMDPASDPEEVRDFFPAEDEWLGHAGVLLAYPTGAEVHEVELPPALVEDPAFVSHDLMLPFDRKVEQRPFFLNGTHWGNIYLFSDDPERIRRLCQKFERYPFYR